MTMFNAPGNDAETPKIVRIYEMYKNTLYSVAYDVTKNIDDAEDVVNETMAKVLGIINRIGNEEIGTKRCRNLMITIAKNTAIDVLRKKKRQAMIIERKKDEISMKSTEDLYLDMENYRFLVECIGKIDEKYRDTLRLRLIHGLSPKEVSSVLNISEAAVNMRVMRGKRLVGEMIKESAKDE